MIIKEFGNINKKAIVLIHGGGLSWWQWEKHIKMLKDDYRIIVPVIDGHGEDYKTTFISIQDSAHKLTEYINKECDGHVYAVCGLSIGAQIVVEMLADKSDISEYAVIESALVFPMKYVYKSAKLTYDLSYPLVRKRWFAKMQAKTLFVDEGLFERYFEDSSRMSKQTLINIALSNSDFPLPETLKESETKALILVGSKEISIMKKSAYLLNDNIKESTLRVLDKYGHGEISIKHPEEYVEVFLKFTAG